MLEKITYFSGPSGCGKTTLISSLLENNDYIEGNPKKLKQVGSKRKKERIKELYSETSKYALNNMYKRLNKAKYHKKLQNKSNKIILEDRCMHDTLSYLKAAFKYGDISNKEYNYLVKKQEEIHPDKLKPKNIVFIDLPLEDILTNLEKRWKTEGKGFREDDKNYLKTVSESFREYYDTLNAENILKIRNRDELDSKYINDWIKNSMKKPLKYYIFIL